MFPWAVALKCLFPGDGNGGDIFAVHLFDGIYGNLVAEDHAVVHFALGEEVREALCAEAVSRGEEILRPVVPQGEVVLSGGGDDLQLMDIVLLAVEGIHYHRGK